MRRVCSFKRPPEEVTTFADEELFRFMAARRNFQRRHEPSSAAHDLCWESRLMFNKVQARRNIGPFVWEWLAWVCRTTAAEIRKAHIPGTTPYVKGLSSRVKLIQKEAKSRDELRILMGSAASPQWRALVGSSARS